MNDKNNKYESVNATLLPQGMGFFETMEKQKKRFGENWCVVDIEVGQRELFIKWFGTDAIKNLFSDILYYLQEKAQEKGGVAEYFGMEHFCMIMPFDIVELNGLQEHVQEMIASFTGLSGFIPVFGIALMDGSCDRITGYFNQAALSCEGITDSSRQRVNVYDAKLKEKIEEEYRILKSFQEALDSGEICFWLQPQYRVVNRKIVGAEALARWITSSGSFISPGIFVPILEKHRIVSKLDVFIWEEVCKWCRKRLDEGHVLIPVSVNLSRADILSMNVPEYFESLLKKYDLPKNSIKIEVTESAYVDSSSSVGNTISELQKNGFMVLMDDFGSGYSSLNMLKNMNVDLIKLDAQFLDSPENTERKGINILESVVNMTRNLAMPIIVEGVETDEQARFLGDLGCRYAQGYYFSRPMSVPAFEELVEDESIIETEGFVFKANQQLHAREFLDENIYSDAMLNNILGPVVFINQSDDNVDAVRFNDQFFQMMGVSVEMFENFRHKIQEVIYPDDREKLMGLLENAYQHHTVGSADIVRICRPGGMIRWLSLKIYFLSEDVQGRKFYASAQDVTEFQFVNSNLPGAYYRCGVDDDFTFKFISLNFQKMTGFSADEIRIRFDNKLIRMIHPDDVDRVRNEARAVVKAKRENFNPYRICRKNGDYIYVAEQSHLTDRYGSPCWQSMTIDVTDVMHMRNQMRILSKCLNDTILFLRRTPEGLTYETAVHGLSDDLGLDAETLEQSLNSGSFCRWVEGYRNIPHSEYTELFISQLAGGERELKVNLEDGKTVRIIVRADKVDDDKSDIEYIVVMRLAK